ncbi:YaaL family protein [Alicyclobacillus fastidiosus]|uniref:YaaL family protein n=1 Tax=Alicyclobacillus fastidiosus TaxID=392011 RepID=A0ABY6ZH53_9BACL|nr:YaaL family protein [Alicyclobacillus fastidiosus]WAH42177.1 YaaL family protein [Alicyclobacillus fastidiosus]GMA63969.1 hypothetical protein GCM10025859_44090 [Alicyclobacillus fastidiosus]
MTSSESPMEAQVSRVPHASVPNPHTAALHPSHQLDLSQLDKAALLTEILKSRRELMIARQQFEQVSDPLLVDHVVFRIGAAERQLNFLFRLARENDVSFDGMQWEWRDETWRID